MRFPYISPCKWLLFVPALLIGSVFTGCSGGGSSPTPKPTPATAPSITTQPASTSANVGATATFSVTATGTAPLTYAWQLNGKAISGATSSTYTTPTLTTEDDGEQFAVVVSNSAGSVTSNAAKLTVSVQAPQIAVQPANVSVQIGETANFNVTVGGTAPFTYQWTRNGKPISGANSITYSLQNVQLSDSGSTFAVTVSNSAGSVTSGPATLTVTQVPVTINTQPAGGTFFAGESTTLSVSASGTSPLYQWTKNGSAISGATTSSYTPPAFKASDDNTSYAVTVSNQTNSVTSAAAVIRVGPFATSYTTQQGDKLNLYAWPGSKMAILTASNTMDPVVMRKYLKAADGTWNYYAGAVGKLPWIYFNYNGLGTVAEVKSACGAGCTFIGATGMEMIDPYFMWMPQGIPYNVYDQIMFYEMGRSFWLFEPQLGYKSPGNTGCLQTGYAVLMRFRSIAAQGYQGGFSAYYDPVTQDQADAAAQSYNDLVAKTATMIDDYAADTSLSWANTFETGSYTSSKGSCADLFSSLVRRLASKYGDETFIQNLWKEVLKRPAAASNQDALDNFVLAASAAAKKNLTGTFINQWRWPVSTAAQQTAQTNWGNPE